VQRLPILRQSWRDCPASREPRRTLRPRIAARTHWARIEAIHRNREFLVAYREARACWIASAPIPFPVGTYWLRRFAGVPLVS
jgi:putative transposase